MSEVISRKDNSMIDLLKDMEDTIGDFLGLEPAAEPIMTEMPKKETPIPKAAVFEAPKPKLEEPKQEVPVTQVIPTMGSGYQSVSPVAMLTTLNMSDELKGKLDGLDSKMKLIHEMDENVSEMKDVIDEKLNVDFDAMYDNVIDQMNVESVKEYRNIQAVIVEENGKQNNVLLKLDEKTNKLKNRMNHVMICSIVSFVVSVLVMLIQILPALGIKIF